MTPTERASFCQRAPWWTAPVIVGGSGGSGTRGSVLLLQRLGVGSGLTLRLPVAPLAYKAVERTAAKNPPKRSQLHAVVDL